MLKGIIQFIKSKTFLVNIGVYVLILFVGIWLVMNWMASYTNHEKSIIVPSFKGVSLGDLEGFVADKKLRYLIIDSIYDSKSDPGVVISQEPLADEEVKDGRIIYLNISSVSPPKVSMPNLVDRSFRQASGMISSYGLLLGETKFIPDPCSNCVLKQQIRGKDIESGTRIPKGSKINLVIGKGLGDEVIDVPCFYGLTIKDITKKLAEVSLSIGSVSVDGSKDSLLAKVYKQFPECEEDVKIYMGGSMDFYLTTDKAKVNKALDELKDKTKQN